MLRACCSYVDLHTPTCTMIEMLFNTSAMKLDMSNYEQCEVDTLTRHTSSECEKTIVHVCVYLSVCYCFFAFAS
jgi:hypothetical protein